MVCNFDISRNDGYPFARKEPIVATTKQIIGPSIVLRRPDNSISLLKIHKDSYQVWFGGKGRGRHRKVELTRGELLALISNIVMQL